MKFSKISKIIKRNQTSSTYFFEAFCLLSICRRSAVGTEAKVHMVWNMELLRPHGLYRASEPSQRIFGSVKKIRITPVALKFIDRRFSDFYPSLMAEIEAM